MTDPEQVFGIHPAEAALMLLDLSPIEFEIVKRIAEGEMENEEIAKDLGITHGSERVLVSRAADRLGCDSHGFARIWYAAQFLYVYQEEEECPEQN
jgi:DNA-binding CsgD family transcriptional regulator